MAIFFYLFCNLLRCLSFSISNPLSKAILVLIPSIIFYPCSNVPTRQSFFYSYLSILEYCSSNKPNRFVSLFEPTTTRMVLNPCFCIQMYPGSNNFNPFLSLLQHITIPIFFNLFFSIQNDPFPNTLNPVLSI